jgi:hypothetical protein
LENNKVTNAVTGIVAQAVIGLTLTGNSVNIPQLAVGSASGMNLGGSALDSGTLVTRNILSGIGNGLILTNPPLTESQGPQATSFRAQVTLNDITSSTARIKMNADYALDPAMNPTDLSSMQRGNYWGRPCSDSDGFREFRLAGADSPADIIFDSHPYGQSVATTPDGLLPAPCR